MSSSLKFKKTLPKESKIVHKSLIIHRQARFITEEAVCFMFGIKREDIYKIECWQYVVYVHAKSISKFVSYADFPPILGVTPPGKVDRIKWHRRFSNCSKRFHTEQAPKWWTQFYVEELHFNNEFTFEAWDNLLESIKFAFNESTFSKLHQLVSSNSRY